MEARLTLNGLVIFDPTLFDNMVLPSPPSAADIGMEAAQIRESWTIDKTTLINYLSMRTSSMTLVYPDLDYMKTAIHTWSAMNLQTWQRLFDTWFYKYNPLWNKDGKFNTTVSDSRLNYGTSNADARTEGGGANTHYTHGYDSNVIVDADSLTWTHSDKDASSSNSHNYGTGAFSTTDNLTHQEARTEQGNIGVTTTQQMIKEERDLAMFNLFDVIADSFIKFFCVAIY